MDKKRVMIFGGSGMLGSALSLVLAANPRFEVAATVRRNINYHSLPENVAWFNFELNDFSLDELGDLLQGYDYVINGLGYIKQRTNNRKTSISSEMFSSNTVFPLVLDYFARHYDYRLLQIGTDCVFDGISGLYSEDGEMNAIDDYGLSKAIVEGNLGNTLVLRCSIIGPEFRNKLSLLEWFLNQPKGVVLNGFTNHFWNGISTYHFAKIIESCINLDEQKRGLFHIIPQDAVSKYQLLCLFREIFDRQDIQIIPFEDEDSVNRVLETNYAQDNLKFWNQAGYREIPTIQTIIEDCKVFFEYYHNKIKA